MPRGFAAQFPSFLSQCAVNVPVTHRGSQERNIALLQSQFQAKIAHYRTDNAAFELIFALASSGNNVQNLVTVNDFTVSVSHDDTVTITVEGDSKVRTTADDFFLHRPRIG